MMETKQALAVAADVETLPRGPVLADFLPVMHGNEPPQPWTVRARN